MEALAGALVGDAAQHGLMNSSLIKPLGGCRVLPATGHWRQPATAFANVEIMQASRLTEERLSHDERDSFGVLEYDNLEPSVGCWRPGTRHRAVNLRNCAW